MSKLKDLMDMLVKIVNSKPDLMKKVHNWIGPYNGKVLQLQTEEGTWHLVVSRDGLALFEGEYPSPDVIYEGTAQLMVDIFTAQADFRKAMKSWDLVVIGAGHESIPLANLIADVLMSV